MILGNRHINIKFIKINNSIIIEKNNKSNKESKEKTYQKIFIINLHNNNLKV